MATREELAAQAKRLAREWAQIHPDEEAPPSTDAQTSRFNAKRDELFAAIDALATPEEAAQPTIEVVEWPRLTKGGGPTHAERKAARVAAAQPVQAVAWQAKRGTGEWFDCHDEGHAREKQAEGCQIRALGVIGAPPATSEERRDAERLDALEEWGTLDIQTSTDGTRIELYDPEGHFSGGGKTLREAIDEAIRRDRAAMSSQKGA
jgi:hypothetical protein